MGKPKTRLEWIVFDVGNTLTSMDFTAMAALIEHRLTPSELYARERTLRAVLNTHLETCAQTGTPPRTLRTILEYLLQDLEPLRRAESIHRLTLANRRRTLWRVVSPETRLTLARLRELGFHLGIVSNGDGYVEELLERTNLRSYFEYVIDSHHVGRSKPDPEIFSLALQKSGIEDSLAAAYIGDLPAIDIAGALAVGMRAVLYDPYDLFELEIETLRRSGSDDRLWRLHALDELTDYFYVASNGEAPD